MREAFLQGLRSVLQRDERSVLVGGAEELLPELALGPRWISTGAATGTRIGIAAGLALAGCRPWVHGNACELVLSGLEALRQDVCLHHLPVRVIGAGAGFSATAEGPALDCLEDLAVLKALPDLQLFFPVAADQVPTALDLMDRLDGPAYLRLAAAPPASVPPLQEQEQTLTRQYSRGGEVTVVGIGHATSVLLTALEQGLLRRSEASVFGLARFPFQLEEERALVENVRRTGRVLVIEEHYRSGGLGESLRAVLPSATVCDVLAVDYSKNDLHGAAAWRRLQSRLTPTEVAQRAEKLRRTVPRRVQAA